MSKKGQLLVSLHLFLPMPIIIISPLDSRRSNQSILKEINPEYSLEGLMLKLKLQHFGHLISKS